MRILADVASQFVNPNLHVVLIHFPIALLFAGTAIEFFSFLGWRYSGFRAAGRWMILLGALLAVPAALTGVYALSDIARRGVDPTVVAASNWNDLLSVSPLHDNATAWARVVRHTWLEAIAAGALLVTTTLWLACSDRWRGKLHSIFILALLGCCGLVGFGAWDIGEAIYTHGVAVDTTGALDARPIEALKARDLQERLEYLAPPMQIHVIGAGLTIGLAAAALGLAMRAALASPAKIGGVHDIADALNSVGDETLLTFEERRVAIKRATRPVYVAARFWLLASLLTLLTASGGVWLLASPENAGTWNTTRLVQNVFDPTQSQRWWPLNRRSAHVVVGGTMLVSMLLLALAARFAPRRPMLLGMLTSVLLAAVAAQTWLGILLMYDVDPTSTRFQLAPIDAVASANAATILPPTVIPATINSATTFPTTSPPTATTPSTIP